MITIKVIGSHPNQAYNKPLNTNVTPGFRICVTKFSKLCENKKC